MATELAVQLSFLRYLPFLGSVDDHPEPIILEVAEKGTSPERTTRSAWDLEQGFVKCDPLRIKVSWKDPRRYSAGTSLQPSSLAAPAAAFQRPETSPPGELSEHPEL